MKKNIVFVAILLCLCAVVLSLLTVIPTVTEIYTYRVERSKQWDRLYQLVCVSLTPDMTKDEVFDILRQTGDFTVVGNDSGRYWDLHVVFKDDKIKEKYGVFNLTFSDNKYTGTYVNIGFEDTHTICDLQ